MTMHNTTFLKAGIMIAGALLFVGVTALAFEGWMRHSTDIFITAIESGIAWCL